MRLDMGSTIRCLWLKRNEEALLAGAEWEWTENRPEAFVFETFELAEAAAKQLGGLEAHTHAHVYGSDAAHADAMQRQQQRAPLVDPDERRRRHQQMLERMHLT